MLEQKVEKTTCLGSESGEGWLIEERVTDDDGKVGVLSET